VVGPFKRTINGNMYVVLAVDYFTKFSVAKAIPDFTAETTAKFLFEEVVCKLGAPRAIITDHGVNFKANLFKRLCQLCGVTTANSTIYHAEGNGCVERMNKTMKQIMTMYVDDSHANWDEFLQSSISAYNTSMQASIGVSPYEANFGRRPITLADVMLTSSELDLAGPRSVGDYVQQLKANAEKVAAKMNENLVEARRKQKMYYDQNVKDSVSFEVREWVLVVNERNKTGESKSFKQRALGPFEVLEVFNDVNYRIKSVESGKEYVVHYNRLRKYKCRFGMEAQMEQKVSKKKVKNVAGWWYRHRRSSWWRR
jgi:sulfur carrier protein ThiS